MPTRCERAEFRFWWRERGRNDAKSCVCCDEADNRLRCLNIAIEWWADLLHRTQRRHIHNHGQRPQELQRMLNMNGRKPAATPANYRAGCARTSVMKRQAACWLAIAAAGLLAGCAGNLRLLEDGKLHSGSWNAASKTMEVTIEGRQYTGDFSQNVSVGFGQSFGTAFSGGRTAFGSGFGTSLASNGSGQAVMTSADGKVIQCIFQAQMGRGSGQCEGMDGRRYVLVIGDQPGDAAARGQIPMSMSACAGTYVNGRCN